MSLRSLRILICFAPLSLGCLAQTCPTGTKSDKLLCLVPQVFGPAGINDAAKYGTSNGVFTTDFLAASLSPVESSIARQSALLPLASPSAGIIFAWDPGTRAFVSSTDSFGPVFGERAETIGKHRVFLGLTYQYFDFDTLDGLSLKKLPVLLTQPDDSTSATPTTCSASSNVDFTDARGNVTSSLQLCGFIRDVIETTNRIDLKVHQVTTFITFGLTNQIDLSVAIPIDSIRMAFDSNATIINNDSPTRYFYGFKPTQDCLQVKVSDELTIPCLHSEVSNAGSASGIADITIRAKGTAWKGERGALALGVDVRVPTGDQLDFLGAGAAGVRPFAAWSYRSRLSPHALAGYEANGSSIIGGNIVTGQKGRLPSQFEYSGGADIWLTKWMTASFDLVGQEVFQAESATIQTVHDLGQCQDVAGGQQCGAAPVSDTGNPHSTLSLATGSFNSTNASLGVKLKPFSNLLFTANVLLKLNDAGLRSKPVPLAGISYTF